MVKVGDVVNFYNDRFVRGPLYLEGTGPYAALVTHVHGNEDDCSASLAVFINHTLTFQDTVPMNERRGHDTRYFKPRD